MVIIIRCAPECRRSLMFFFPPRKFLLAGWHLRARTSPAGCTRWKRAATRTWGPWDAAKPTPPSCPCRPPDLYVFGYFIFLFCSSFAILFKDQKNGCRIFNFLKNFLFKLNDLSIFLYTYWPLYANSRLANQMNRLASSKRGIALGKERDRRDLERGERCFIGTGLRTLRTADRQRYSMMSQVYGPRQTKYVEEELKSSVVLQTIICKQTIYMNVFTHWTLHG